MPFGARINADGTVRFRLWAPSSENTCLALYSGSEETSLPMRSLENGWHELTANATAGMFYKYVTGDGLAVPDPASRYQPEDVHGRSQIVDPKAFNWTDTEWKGLPWSKTVLYELHVGTFTPEGTFAGVAGKLDYLKDLGVTAIELMPLADFPGKFGWGYDGVLPFAPESQYGSPDELKSLVQQAHQKGLQVFLDVVYNHFGPEGNYLHAYAREFFTDQHKTPWGAALNFQGHCEVRDFFIENALYWLEEYNIDGLRLDAVHAIKDDSATHILTELANRVIEGPGRERARHLVLENDDNIARFLERNKDSQPKLYAAQWNDDIHHAYHVLATEESNGYYADYVSSSFAPDTISMLGRALSEGFIYQNNPSALRDGERRGEKSAHLPPSAFISFIQNHDQIGNRAFGDRIASISKPDRLNALTTVQLLAPSIPLLFMGEEWAATSPFMYFCDLGPELAPLVTEGRRNEFAKFPEFSNPETRHKIPDPCTSKTFEDSKLNWSDLEQIDHQTHLQLVRQLLELRQKEISPLLPSITSGSFTVENGVLTVEWKSGSNPVLLLITNLTSQPRKLSQISFKSAQWTTLYSSKENLRGADDDNDLPSYSVLWLIHERGENN